MGDSFSSLIFSWYVVMRFYWYFRKEVDKNTTQQSPKVIILREIFSVASVVSDVIGRQNAEREVAGSNPGSVNQHSMSLKGFCGSVLVQTILKLLVDNFNYAELYL